MLYILSLIYYLLDRPKNILYWWPTLIVNYYVHPLLLNYEKNTLSGYL